MTYLPFGHRVGGDADIGHRVGIPDRTLLSFWLPPHHDLVIIRAQGHLEQPPSRFLLRRSEMVAHARLRLHGLKVGEPVLPVGKRLLQVE